MANKQPLAGNLLDQLPIAAARLDEYFDSWAIEEQRGLALERMLRSMDVAQHLSQWDAKQAAKRSESASGNGYRVVDGIALIDLAGTLMKQESSFGGSTSTVAVRRSLRQAAADPSVVGVMLLIDSPGGTSAGTGVLAEAVQAARQSKPVWAYAEDCCCSAAYWIASQAERIVANKDAIVGSIGTFLVVRDWSARYAAEGVKTYVIRAGAHKGAGVEGTEVTPEQLAEMQRVVDGINSGFVAAVAQGRGLTADEAAALADGRVHIGSEAVQRKLIDGVGSLDRTLIDFRNAIQKRKGKTMSDSNPEPKAATIAELRGACTGASDSFVLAQLERGATAQEALRAFSADQQATIGALKGEVAKLQSEVDSLKAAHDAAGPKRPGHKTPDEKPKSGDSEATAKERVELLVAEQMKLGKTQSAAFADVMRRNPELREEYVAEANR